ncbi:MAG: UDP-3-O-(3-hydroxymyristoyl)glucosamine N-acyltransferase [bacterium]
MRLSDVAKRVGGKLVGADTDVEDICSARRPRPGCLAYAETQKAAEQLQNKDVAAVLCPPIDPPLRKPMVTVTSPKEGLARALALFRPPAVPPPLIHSTAGVSSKAHVAEGVSVGAFAVVEEGAHIGAFTIVYPFVYIGRNVTVGERCTLYPGAVVMENCTLGNEVTVLPGAVVGGEGFGFYQDADGTSHKIPQRGGVHMKDHSEVGANSTIDSGTIEPTIIGPNSKLDNLIQIGHNCELGAGVLVAAQCGIAGSTLVGDGVIIGPQAGLRDHIKVGERAVIVGRSAVFGDLPPKVTVSGYPASNHQRALRVLAITQQLPEILERLKQLEKKLADLESSGGQKGKPA